jgi:branched-chain amino acid:cation transporter, LIVCS family
MEKSSQSTTLTIGLAIFAMLFGAGNLIFPPTVGILAGNKTAIGLIAFIITAVLLPLTGLVGMVFFDGNYQNFFERVGRTPGKLLIFLCMLIIGPLLVMPRIVGLTYELIHPFTGDAVSMPIFSIAFAFLTFVCCYHKDKVVNLLGKVLSPLKLISIFGIIAAGFWLKQPMQDTGLTSWAIFKESFTRGYETLDLIGMIFFAYIILQILKRNSTTELAHNHRALAQIVMQGGLIGGTLLALVYIGMGYLGAFHGQGLGHLDPGKIFITTIIRILGDKGALFISITVLIACLSTMIALASVVSDYLRNDIFNRRISYATGLLLVLATTTFIAQFKLGALLYYSQPLLLIIYPVIIVLTFCNIAYKVWGFRPVKLPVLVAFIVSTCTYGPQFIERITKKTTVVPSTQKIASL